ncbi:MAG: nuoL [Acidimicrobiales bacterium]|nr:nuoL [Acidimicrobiales bacterium]
MRDLIWLIPALPLAGFAILLVAGKRLGESLAGWLATAMVGASFLVTVGVFLTARGSAGGHEHRLTQSLYTWIVAGDFRVDLGFLVDPLSISMCLFVTGIAALIHLYSIGYMHGDERYHQFFMYLNLFVFSMLMLVLGDNLLVTFLGWEGVGACSYFLISFWFDQEANASAGKKAFVTNRIGDWGFMCSIFFTFSALGTISYVGIIDGASSLPQTTATAIAGLLFVGAIGKSAQLPLFVWLPDAMAGPTPVSALIHAATMVTAGVYVMTRINPVLAQTADWLPTLIATVGAVTALFAATVALAQNDIKKVLAYSTVSQLGYMFLAVGSGAYVAAIFHMITHAFFKALLFLGAGSVIHGVGGEQDMRRMGALRKLMPITAATFIVGWLAIAGVPPFSGFFSKDEILLYAWDKSPVLWAIGLVTAILTAFYMGRQVFMVFYGHARWDDARPAAAADGAHLAGEAEHSAEAVEVEETGADAEGAVVTAHAATDAGADVDHAHAGAHGDVHPHESPWTMTLPLVLLAGGAVVAGALNMPFASRLQLLEHWLEPVVHAGQAHLSVGSGVKVALGAVAVIGALAGLAFAVLVYLRDRRDIAEKVEQPVFARGWGYDAAISAFVDGPGRRIFDAVAWFDRTIVDGAVNGVATLVRGGGDRARTLQSGYVRNYALGVAFGAVVLVGLLLSRAVF